MDGGGSRPVIGSGWVLEIETGDGIGLTKGVIGHLLGLGGLLIGRIRTGPDQETMLIYLAWLIAVLV